MAATRGERSPGSRRKEGVIPARPNVLSFVLRGRRSNAEVVGQATKNVTVKEVVATKVDVPDEVKKWLE